MKIKMLDSYSRSLKEIFRYNTRYSVKYVRKLNVAINKKIERLKDFPYIGRYLPEDDFKQYRELICQKYRILYTISEETDTVYIHYVIYAGRNFRAFFKLYNSQKPNK